MPELPEVEVTRLGLLPLCQAGEISHVHVHQPSLRWPVPSKLLKKYLPNQSIQSISRRGKYLLFETKCGYFMIHLGMSGHIKYLSAPTPRDKHDHIEIGFANGALIRLYDPRRFGALLWLGCNPFDSPHLIHLGVEPLSQQFCEHYLFTISRRSRQAIKTFLMDQKNVVGIGNIYANEALFLARISPHQPSQTLTVEQCQLLTKSCKKILKKAIKAGGTTLKDFAQSDGKPGYFSQQLLVYGKKGAPCPTCQTPILSDTLNQRGTFYCPACQAF